MPRRPVVAWMASPADRGAICSRCRCQCGFETVAAITGKQVQQAELDPGKAGLRGILAAAHGWAPRGRGHHAAHRDGRHDGGEQEPGRAARSARLRPFCVQRVPPRMCAAGPPAAPLALMPASCVPPAQQEDGQAQGERSPGAQHREACPWRQRIVAVGGGVGVGDLRILDQGLLDGECRSWREPQQPVGGPSGRIGAATVNM